MKCHYALLVFVAILSSNIAVARNGTARMYQHWDCCKATCSEAKTCQKDGINTTSSSTQTACEGGDGYACNKYQPWNVSATEGFAFVTSQFTGSKNYCCTCYKLQTTSGKTLTVQVIQSSYSLSSDQFNVWIPGTGVGVNFEGCQRQWNTPLEGWGDLYSGVSTREECISLLPEVLQPGCLFRFDFWTVYRSERVQYTQVTCPSELSEISGCSK